MLARAWTPLCSPPSNSAPGIYPDYVRKSENTITSNPKAPLSILQLLCNCSQLEYHFRPFSQPAKPPYTSPLEQFNKYIAGAVADVMTLTVIC